jgi:hypothetical protein
MKLPNGTSSCSAVPKAKYCQEVFDVVSQNYFSINQTVKTCMEDVLVYIFPANETNITNNATI